MNRAVVGDLRQPHSLVRGQGPEERDLHVDSIDHPGVRLASDAILRVGLLMGQTNAHSLERPLSPLGIHPDGDAGAGPQRAKEQLVWPGAYIISASIDRFICLEYVSANR